MLQTLLVDSSFFSFFTFLFIVVFIFIIAVWIANLARIFRRPSETQSTQEGAAVVKEREIIREIVKIRCPYCNNLYDEKYDKCPHCGGKRKP